MGRLRNGFLTVGLAGVTALSAAGCGGGGDGKDTGTTAAAQAPAASTPAPAASTPAPAATTPAPATTTSVTAAPASDPIAKAAAAAARLNGGVTVQLRGTITSAGHANPISGKGTVDRSSGRGMFNLKTGVNGQAIPIREVMDGHTMYITSKLFSHRLPGKRSWMKIDLSKASKTPGFDLASLGTNGPSQDPAQILDYLQGAGASKKVGTATVHGVKTTHYKAVVDLAAAKAKATSKSSKAAFDELTKTLGAKTTLPVDVWLDAQHRVLRERVRYTATISGVKSGLDYTTDFTDFGAKVKVDKPPASDTVDGLALIKNGAGAQPSGA